MSHMKPACPTLTLPDEQVTVQQLICCTPYIGFIWCGPEMCNDGPQVSGKLPQHNCKTQRIYLVGSEQFGKFLNRKGDS